MITITEVLSLCLALSHLLRSVPLFFYDTRNLLSFLDRFHIPSTRRPSCTFSSQRTLHIRHLLTPLMLISFERVKNTTVLLICQQLFSELFSGSVFCNLAAFRSRGELTGGNHTWNQFYGNRHDCKLVGAVSRLLGNIVQ